MKQMRKILAWLRGSERQNLALLSLPSQGCLRVIHKRTAVWNEFELADVLVVLPDHTVIPTPTLDGE